MNTHIYISGPFGLIQLLIWHGMEARGWSFEPQVSGPTLYPHYHVQGPPPHRASTLARARQHP
jgi:hypothetical protein